MPRLSVKWSGFSVLAIQGVQVGGYLLPLLSIPYLTRTLGLGGWGSLSYFQSISALIALAIEYGFVLSKGRDLAACPDDKKRSMIAAVIGARITLTLTACVAFALFSLSDPVLRANPYLASLALIFALVQGNSLLWLFLGFQRALAFSVAELLSRILYTGSLFLFVKSPADYGNVLLLQILSNGALLGYSVFAFRSKGLFSLAPWREIASCLRNGSSLFIYSLFLGLYTLVNTYLLGRLIGPERAGDYATADKILRLLVGLVIFPVNRIFLPRISADVVKSAGRAMATHRQAAAILLGTAILSAGLLFAFADPFIPLAFGEQFVSAVDCFRIIILALPLMAGTNIFGVLYLVPTHRDKTFTCGVVLAGVCNLLLAPLLVSRFGSNGMSASVVISELTVLFFFAGSFLLDRNRWSLRKKELNERAP